MKNLFSLIFTTVFFLATSAFAEQPQAPAAKKPTSEAPLHIDKKSHRVRLKPPTKSAPKAAPAAPAPSKHKDNSAKPLEEQIDEADKSDLDQE